MALLAVAATGCGSASGATGGASDAAAIVKSGAAAVKTAHSVGFDVKATVNLDGSLKGVNASQGAILNGPLTLELKGHAAKSGTTGEFDTTFDLGASGFVVSGEIKSADGKTAYIRVPMLLGPGWKSVSMKNQGITLHRSALQSDRIQANGKLEKRLAAANIDPVHWLKNIVVSSDNGDDTVSADLNVTRLATDIGRFTAMRLTRGELAQASGAIRVAHGSVSYDSSTHLPSAAQVEVAVKVPAKFAKQSQGLTGADVKIDATFDDWNQPVNVTAPAHATPLNLSHIQGFKLS